MCLSIGRSGMTDHYKPTKKNVVRSPADWIGAPLSEQVPQHLVHLAYLHQFDTLHRADAFCALG
jgi:hypothetical protein